MVSSENCVFTRCDYDMTGALTHMREIGALSSIGVLATYAYYRLG